MIKLRFIGEQDIEKVQKFLKDFNGTLSHFATKPFLDAIDEWNKSNGF